MTDYSSFIIHEVSKLHRNTREDRPEAYERAREELLAKLRRPALRVAEAEVADELRAFDAAVRRVEAEIVRAQALDTGVAASTTSGTSSDSTGSIPIIGIEAESREITQSETEAAEIRHIREGKSEPLGGGTDSDSDQLRQMLQAIGRALDLAVHPERTSNAIGKEQAEPRPTEANFPNSRKASGPLALSNFPGSLDELVGLGTTIVSMPRGTVVVPQVGADFDRKSDLPPRTHAGVAVARSMLMQLTNMALAIVICCVVFAVIYFTVNIRNWLGL